MASLEDRIDDLYRVPLPEFVSARADLARTLSGEDAKRIKALKKPTVVPWAVNQLFWSARAVYHRLVKRGAALRQAQLASLKERSADVRQAAGAHRDALIAAVKDAERLAAAHGAHPDVDALTRTLEALSLAVEKTPEPVGRLTVALQPAGFESLAGVAIKAPTAAPHAAERRRAQEDAKAERQRASVIRRAELVVMKARAREAETRRAWERAKADLEAAERKLSQ